MSQKCPTCLGAKNVMKIGGMKGKCNTCHGSGFIKETQEKIKKTKKAE
jgi:DnaJ-class molecular chaperone